MHVAVYARHSSDKQEHSTRDQIARCQKWCEQKGYTIVHVFCDEEISGSHITNRQGLRRLIKTSLLSDFTRVITEDLSRISRDQEDMAGFYKKMTFLDIKIETITEGIINELHIGLKGTMNALYLKDLADKTHRGMVAAVLNGSIPGGRAYGYEVVHEMDSKGEPIRGRRKINEEEAKIVRWIFNRYIARRTLAQICESLNRRTIPAPKGGKWISSVLIGTTERNTGILRQTLYNGIVTFNKQTYKKHPITGKRLSTMRPKKEWIMVPAPDLAIVTKKIWNKVQTLVKRRSSMAKIRYRQSTILTAAELKAKQLRHSRESRARQFRPRIYKLNLVFGKLWCVYHERNMRSVCAGVHACHNKTCNNQNFKRPLLIRLTQESIAALTLADLELYVRSNRDQIAAIRDNDLSRLQAKLDAKRVEITNIMMAFETSPPGQEAKRYLDKKETECRRIFYEISICNEKIKDLGDFTSEQLKSIHRKYMAIVHAHIAAPNNDKLNEILHPLIVKIKVSAAWNNDIHKYMPEVEAELDLSKILRTFKPGSFKDFLLKQTNRRQPMATACQIES